MKNSKILVVDDNPRVSSMVRVFLQRLCRYEVREENRSSDALTTAKEFRPDLIILDVDMPDKDGGDVHAELRADPDLENVPVMFLSGLVARGEERMSGGTHCLSKPVELNALVEMVRNLIAGPATVPVAA